MSAIDLLNMAGAIAAGLVIGRLLHRWRARKITLAAIGAAAMGKKVSGDAQPPDAKPPGQRDGRGAKRFPGRWWG